MTFFTYVLECADGTLYTGWTNDLGGRVATHNQARGAKYTRSRLPVRLKGYWSFETKEEAMSFEWRFKRLSRSEKQQLLAETSSIEITAP